MTVQITIDGQTLEVEKGITILEAAQRNGIYIPTLCAHKHLTPFGACRMCLVEVEGMRKLPTSCTTPVEQGQIIRTNTPKVQALRADILRLILSEHPISCLVCLEKDNCSDCMGTVRKVGYTTGCGSCPKNHQCELQDLVEQLGIKDLDYPVKYRLMKVEKYDPFYDRDYNLCILCGRCVNICEQIHFSSTIAFKQRGARTIIGPAYGRTHLESGCDFCGACVTICPTGTLMEKTRKWDGVADRQVTTTCPFCSIGCQIDLQVKGNDVIGGLPAEDPEINKGQLCMKGRFAVPETVNHHSRLKNPLVSKEKSRLDISWEEALAIAAGKLANCPPEGFGMLVSPTCTNEELYIAQKFTRLVMSSHNIAASAREFYGAAFNQYIELVKRATPLSSLAQADVILSIGLDTHYTGAILEIELIKAKQNGAIIYTVLPQDHHLAMAAEKWLRLSATEIPASLEGLLALLSGKPADQKLPEGLADVAAGLQKAKKPVILLGSAFLRAENAADIFKTIGLLVEQTRAGLLVFPPQNNLVGSLQAGAYGELLPGGTAANDAQKLAQINALWQTNLPTYVGAKTFQAPLQVLYLMGEMPPAGAAKAAYTISQHSYPPADGCPVDLLLPAAAFTEMDGTFTNREGRIQQVHKAVEPPGGALPGWQIVCHLAQKMGYKGFDYASLADVQKEMAVLMDGFDPSDRSPKELSLPAALLDSASASGLWNTELITEHTYQGYPLTTWVAGMRLLYPDEPVPQPVV